MMKSKILILTLPLIFLFSPTYSEAQPAQKHSHSSETKIMLRAYKRIIFYSNLTKSSLDTKEALQKPIVDQIRALNQQELKAQSLQNPEARSRALLLISRAKKTLAQRYTQIAPKLDPLILSGQNSIAQSKKILDECGAKIPDCPAKIRTLMQRHQISIPSPEVFSTLPQELTSLIQTQNRTADDPSQRRGSTPPMILPKTLFSSQSVHKTSCDDTMEKYLEDRIKTPTDSQLTQTKINLFKLLKAENTLANQRVNQPLTTPEPFTCVILDENHEQGALSMQVLKRLRTAALIKKYAKGNEDIPKRTFRSWISSIFPGTLAHKSLKAQKCADEILKTIPAEEQSFINQQVIELETFLNTANIKARLATNHLGDKRTQTQASTSVLRMESIRDLLGGDASDDLPPHLLGAHTDGCRLEPSNIHPDTLSSTKVLGPGEHPQVRSSATSSRNQARDQASPSQQTSASSSSRSQPQNGAARSAK